MSKAKTGLFDKLGNTIRYGQIVHWTDGGDDLSLEERIKERWDRIAVVEKYKGISPSFRVIDSPNEYTKIHQQTFRFGSFIYEDTENWLTIVAENEKEYFKKFNNAGECMAWVLERTSNGH